MATNGAHPEVTVAVALRKPPDPDLWRSAHAGEDVYDMNAVTFEDLISVALCEYGYKGVQVTGYDDNGTNLVARRNGRLILIQVKRWESRVDETAIVQALQRKVAYGCRTAMVITNSVFTHEARGLAKLRRVALWDQDDLANVLQTTGIASRARTAAPNCPTCGDPMTLLWQRRPAWGCSHAPPCAARVTYRKWVLRICNPPPMGTLATAASASPDSPPPPPPAHRTGWGVRALRMARRVR